MNLSKLWETVEDRGAWRAAVRQQRGIEKSSTWLSNWTTTIGVIRTHPHTPAAGGLSAHVPRFYISNIWAQRTGCNSDPSNMEVCQWREGTISNLLCVCVVPCNLRGPFTWSSHVGFSMALGGVGWGPEAQRWLVTSLRSHSTEPGGQYLSYYSDLPSILGPVMIE